MPVLIVSTVPPVRRSAVPTRMRAGRALWILALLNLTATASPLAAQADRPLWREPGPSTPRLLVAGYAPASESNRAAATAMALAVQRRVPSATLWVYPTDVVDLAMERLRSDSTVDRAILNCRTLAALLRAAHWLEVRATTWSSQVELTGRLFRTPGDAPVFVLTVTGTTLEAAVDSLAARLLRESDLLPGSSRPPQSGDPGDPRSSDRVLSAVAILAPRGQGVPAALVSAVFTEQWG